jgi:hypothetical protein
MPEFREHRLNHFVGRTQRTELLAQQRHLGLPRGARLRMLHA